MPKVSIDTLEEQFDLQQAAQEDDLPTTAKSPGQIPFRHSKLKPYKRAILEFREAGKSYSEIAKWLCEKGCQITGPSVGAFVNLLPKKETIQSSKVEAPAGGLAKTLFDKYGPAMTVQQLAEVLHRSPEGLRIALMQKPVMQPFSEALLKTRFKFGRWVRFRTTEVAELIVGDEGLSTQFNADLATPSPTGDVGDVLFAKYGPIMTVQQLADVLHRSSEGIRISLAQNPESRFNKALIAARFKINRGIRFRTAEIANILKLGVPNDVESKPEGQQKTPAGNHQWTPEEDALLATSTFKAVASKLGLQISEVASRALTLGCQPVGLSSPIDRASFEEWIWDRFHAEQTGADWSDSPPDLPEYI